jgi:hypothetical protein
MLPKKNMCYMQYLFVSNRARIMQISSQSR